MCLDSAVGVRFEVYRRTRVVSWRVYKKTDGPSSMCLRLVLQEHVFCLLFLTAIKLLSCRIIEYISS